MVFWIFVEKNKKTVFEANGRYKHKKTQTKNAQKAKSQAKNQVFCQPCSDSIDNVEQKILQARQQQRGYSSFDLCGQTRQQRLIFAVFLFDLYGQAAGGWPHSLRLQHPEGVHPALDSKL